MELFVILKQSHPFQNVQDTRHFLAVLPIPNKQMEFRRDSYQPSLIKLLTTTFLDLAVAKSLQSTRMVTDDADDDDADDADVLTTTGYTC